MAILFKLLKAYKVIDRVCRHPLHKQCGLSKKTQISFDMSLARGLDYYTGIIYEAVVAASAPPGLKSDDPADTTSKPKKKSSKKSKTADGGEEEDEIDESTVGVGSIAAGGRYDNLVGSLVAASSGDGKKNAGTPCVGVSIGLDRIFAILYPKWVEKGMRQKETLAFVMAAQDGLLVERVQLVTELREAGIKVSPPS